jgi:hypothetical protein
MDRREQEELSSERVERAKSEVGGRKQKNRWGRIEPTIWFNHGSFLVLSPLTVLEKITGRSAPYQSNEEIVR